MRITSAILAILVLVPQVSFAMTSAESLLKYSEMRREQRLHQNNSDASFQWKLTERGVSAPSGVMRLGRVIIQQPFSPRRIRRMQDAKVINVVDGSLFVVELADGSQTGVRILGADAPVVTETGTMKECFSLESRLHLETMIRGKMVRLEKEENSTSQIQKDRYGNLVRYVRLGGRDVGSAMIRYGYAFSDKKNSYQRQQTYRELEQLAREDDVGLWSYRCDYEMDADESLTIVQ